MDAIIEARRKAFEAWAAEESEIRQYGSTIGLLQDEHHDRYSMIWTQNAWTAWNAALDQIEVELPDCIEIQDSGDYQCEVIDRLTAAGIRIK